MTTPPLTSTSSLLWGLALLLLSWELPWEFFGCSFFLFWFKLDSWGQHFFRIWMHLSNITGWKTWLTTLPIHKEWRVSKVGLIALKYVCYNNKILKNKHRLFLNFEQGTFSKKVPFNFCPRQWAVNSVQSLSHVRLFAAPWTAARQAFLSITNSWSWLKLMSIDSVMPSYHLIPCCPLLLLPLIFPRVFSNELVLRIR